MISQMARESFAPCGNVHAPTPLAAGQSMQKQRMDYQEQVRFRETEENLAIFQVKQRGLEVIDLFFNFRFYVRLQVGVAGGVALWVWLVYVVKGGF